MGFTGGFVVSLFLWIYEFVVAESRKTVNCLIQPVKVPHFASSIKDKRICNICLRALLKAMSIWNEIQKIKRDV